MTSNEALLELVRELGKRPGLYVRDASLEGICTYLRGYAHGAPDCPIASRAFNSFVNHRQGWPDKYVWVASLIGGTADDAEGLKRLEELVEAFLDEVRTSDLDELEARFSTTRAEEALGGPEATCREFLRASLAGDEAGVRRTALARRRLSVLWKKKFPPDEAKLLLGIGEEQRIGRSSRTASSDDPDKVHLVTGSHRLTAVRKGDGWRIDPSPLIKVWSKSG